MLALRRDSWTEPVRGVLARQLLFTGVDGTSAAIRFGAAVGVVIIVQTALWVDAIGLSTEVIAPMLWRAIVRELAPLLACLVVIGRSGIAISTELATMLVDGELEVLDAQGIDQILRQFNTLDLVFFVPKTIIAGGFAGAICCLDGLNVRGTITDVPRVSSRSGIHALTAVFAISAILSIVIYGRFLFFKVV